MSKDCVQTICHWLEETLQGKDLKEMLAILLVRRPRAITEAIQECISEAFNEFYDDSLYYEVRERLKFEYDEPDAALLNERIEAIMTELSPIEAARLTRREVQEEVKRSLEADRFMGQLGTGTDEW